MLVAALVIATIQSIDHSAFTSVLAKHTTPEGVRYAALQKERGGLDAYVSALGKVAANDFDRWGRHEQIAYLVNAYNAIVIKQVIDNYPIKRSLNPAALLRPANSVWQIGGFFSELKQRVAGRDLTLDEIEHKWLRERLKEPRIHAALVCAARSCPPLRNEAYTADRLDMQLDDQMRRFLLDASKNKFDRKRNTVQLSEIFKWFGADFEPQGGVLAFAARYLSAEDAAWLKAAKPKLSFIDYDWSLNEAQ